MTTFKFKDKTVRKGDLVLLVKEKTPTPILCLAQGVGHSSSGTLYLQDRKPITLREPEEFNGTLLAMVGSPICGLFEDNISEFYVGKRDISKYLDGRGWDLHAQWIRNLEEPVKKFPIETVKYVPVVYGTKSKKK